MKKQKGISLIEALVYLGIYISVLTLIISFVFWLANSNTRVKAVKEVSDNANRIMNIIVSEIRRSEEIYLPTTSDNQLTLRTKRYLPDGETFAYIDFFLCGAGVCFKREFQNPIVLNSDDIEISNLFFEKVVSNGVYSIQISLTVDHKNPGNRQELNASIDLISTASARSY